MPGTLLYEHGDPTDDQQHMVELINRARSDPSGEGDRIAADYNSASVKFEYDGALAADPLHWTRAESQAAWRTYSQEPPLVFNQNLALVGNQWSIAMRSADRQAQTLPGQPGLLTRMGQNGYPAFWSGQLVNGYAADVLTAYASWAVDWGQVLDPTTGRPGLWNRAAIINHQNQAFLDFVEVGPGFVRRDNPPPGGVGPLVATLVLGTRAGANLRYVTGVVYEDKDFDQMWDPGEGLPGVRIDVNRSSSYAISSSSGGYAVPVDGFAGAVTIRATGVAGTVSELFTAQSTTGSTLQFGRAGNIKADFRLQDRVAPPAAAAFDAVPGAVPALGSTEFPFAVSDVHPLRTLVGDVDLDIDFAHPERGQVGVTLRSPSGTEVKVWEADASGADLAGTFDASLRPHESLDSFIGEPWLGTWTLVIADTSGQAGNLVSARLHIRPRYEGPVFARSVQLFVTKLKVKDRKKVGRDSVAVSLDAETGGGLDTTGPMEIVLRDLDGLAEVVRLDVGAALAAGGEVATANGTLTARVDGSVRGTSKARVTAKLVRTDLPVVGSELRVELLAGDAFLTEDVRAKKGVYRGRRTPPLGEGLRIDAVTSKRAGATGRKTVIKGRYLGRGLPPIPPLAELRVGDVAALWRGLADVLEETRIQYGRNNRVRKLVLNPRRNTFKAILDGAHSVLDADGRIRISLWLGEFYGEAEVTPALVPDRIVY